ncbi:Transforming protein RhoA [Dictyocoela muelleri]|nr:Transforming protein RhoA [Dictyocoela muelleri]
MKGKPISSKIILIGDTHTGKTSILKRLIDNTFSMSYSSTYFDTFSYLTNYKDKCIELKCWDIAGSDDYDRIATLAYPNTNIVLLCYAVDSMTSFKNLQSKYLKEVSFYCNDVKIVVVATKCDLDRVVMPEMGKEFANSIGAIEFFECSSKNNTGVRELFFKLSKIVYYDYRAKNRFKWLKNLWKRIYNSCRCC